MECTLPGSSVFGESTGFSRQEYWPGLPFPSPGDLLDPGIESGSPALQEDSLPCESPENQHVKKLCLVVDPGLLTPILCPLGNRWHLLTPMLSFMAYKP